MKNRPNEMTGTEIGEEANGLTLRELCAYVERRIKIILVDMSQHFGLKCDVISKPICSTDNSATNSTDFVRENISSRNVKCMTSYFMHMYLYTCTQL